MAENKRSFLLYADLIHTVRKMPKEKAGELLLIILKYVNDENPIVDDMVVDLVFEPIKQQLKRDLLKYEDKRKQWSEAGKRSAESRKESIRQRTLTDIEGRLTDSTVSVNDTVSAIQKKEYIYTKFYDSEIEKASNLRYEQFVKYLFGDNMLKQKLIGVLSIKNQLSESEFVKILDKYKVNKKKVGDILTKIENDKKYYKGKTSLYRTLLNWSEDRFTK